MVHAIIFNQSKKIKGKYYYLARFGWCLHQEGYVVPISWMKKHKIDFKGESVTVNC